MDCGYQYKTLNDNIKTFLLLIVCFGVVYIIKLINNKTKGENIKNYLVQDKIKIIIYFIVIAILIGGIVYTGIKENEEKNKEECVNKN